MQAGETRIFSLQASGCNLPSSAQAYALNFTAVPKTNRLAYLTVWPTGQGAADCIDAQCDHRSRHCQCSYRAGRFSGQISVFSTDPADLIVDVSGYYAPPASGGLALYNVTPCRAFDSREAMADRKSTGVFSPNVAGWLQSYPCHCTKHCD